MGGFSEDGGVEWGLIHDSGLAGIFTLSSRVH